VAERRLVLQAVAEHPIHPDVREPDQHDREQRRLAIAPGECEQRERQDVAVRDVVRPRRTRSRSSRGRAGAAGPRTTPIDRRRGERAGPRRSGRPRLRVGARGAERQTPCLHSARSSSSRVGYARRRRHPMATPSFSGCQVTRVERADSPLRASARCPSPLQSASDCLTYSRHPTPTPLATPGSGRSVTRAAPVATRPPGPRTSAATRRARRRSGPSV
jgi:hypothetical protein